MNLHEYQAKRLMRHFGLPVLRGVLCYTPGECEAAFDALKSQVAVIKAQVHAGGRGKAGGVKLARSGPEARALGEKMLGMTLVTPQTGEKGKLVRKVFVEEGCNIGSEFYLSILVDRAARSLGIVASPAGGMDIEEVAHKTPEKIFKYNISTQVGLQQFQCTALALKLGLKGELIPRFLELMQRLVGMFLNKDLSMIEVNPLVLTKDGQFVILDAKCSVDDNALFRQTDLKSLNDYDEQDPKDVEAAKLGLSYVALDGNIGCMVNGAGLAMATMDIIKTCGGNPANFLDVGGGASKETVTQAFKLLLSDKNVKAILVNIFGGIMRCDLLAQGIVEAARELAVRVPLVVRLQGTNVEQGRKILAESGLKITPADTMDEAATKVVAAAKL